MKKKRERGGRKKVFFFFWGLTSVMTSAKKSGVSSFLVQAVDSQEMLRNYSDLGGAVRPKKRRKSMHFKRAQTFQRRKNSWEGWANENPQELTGLVSSLWRHKERQMGHKVQLASPRGAPCAVSVFYLTTKKSTSHPNTGRESAISEQSKKKRKQTLHFF